MSDDIALFLRLSAEHQGVSREEIVLRAIPHFAATIVGLPGLADAIHCGGRAAEARQSHKLEVASSNLAPATIFNVDGELTDVPAFDRVRLSRFTEPLARGGSP